VWLMDRGVPTEEVLPSGQARGPKAHEMRAVNPPVHYFGHAKESLDPTGEAADRQAVARGTICVQVKLLAQRVSSMSWHRAATASPSSGRCGGAS
jgi:hypothetical protein